MKSEELTTLAGTLVSLGIVFGSQRLRQAKTTIRKCKARYRTKET